MVSHFSPNINTFKHKKFAILAISTVECSTEINKLMVGQGSIPKNAKKRVKEFQIKFCTRIRRFGLLMTSEKNPQIKDSKLQILIAITDK